MRVLILPNHFIVLDHDRPFEITAPLPNRRIVLSLNFLFDRENFTIDFNIMGPNFLLKGIFHRLQLYGKLFNPDCPFSQLFVLLLLKVF